MTAWRLSSDRFRSGGADGGDEAVMVDPGLGPTLARAGTGRTDQIVDALQALDEGDLLAPSQLPDWSRLTIACHLRYLAHAHARMTADAVSGRPTSFYPMGRSRQRPATLRPDEDERPVDVPAALRGASTALTERWERLMADDWARPVVEPEDNPDIGPATVAVLALLRLTEVEVHGSDLGLGLPDWDDVFVAVALPFRIRWLCTGGGVRGPVGAAIRGSWLLAAADGPAFLVTVSNDGVVAGEGDLGMQADAIIEGRSRDLLAFLLGRTPVSELSIRGDRALAAAFKRVFPGP
jgi:maleylpyruvate isomerase